MLSRLRDRPVDPAALLEGRNEIWIERGYCSLCGHRLPPDRWMDLPGATGFCSHACEVTHERRRREAYQAWWGEFDWLIPPTVPPLEEAVNIFEVGFIALVAVFSIEFSAGCVTLTKRAGDITLDDVRLVQSYLLPGAMVRQQGRTLTATALR